MGPLCGKCKRDDPLSYMKDSRCYRCKGGEVSVVVSVLVMVIAIPLVVALVLYRCTLVRALTYRIYRRVFDIGRFKVVCGPVPRSYFDGLLASVGSNEMPLVAGAHRCG